MKKRMTAGEIQLENIGWLLDQGMSTMYIMYTLRTNVKAVRQLAQRHGDTRVAAAFGAKVTA